MLYPLLLCALLPLGLHDALDALPALSARLIPPPSEPPNQLALFRAQLLEPHRTVSC